MLYKGFVAFATSTRRVINRNRSRERRVLVCVGLTKPGVDIPHRRYNSVPRNTLGELQSCPASDVTKLL